MKKLYSTLFLAVLLITATKAVQPTYYPIGQINHQDATTGVADSLNKRFKTSGTVYGVNLAAAGKLSFFISDGTGAIQVYSPHGWGYTVNEGDSVVIVGSLTQYGGVADCGQLEIKASVATVGDTIYKAGTGTIMAAEVVSALDEAHESHLIRLNGLTMSFPADWNNSATGFSVRTSQGPKVYINKYTNATTVVSPGASAFDLIGLESQYDTSAPYTQYYSVSPRYASDIITVTGISEVNSNALRAILFPNPSNNQITVSFMAGENTNGEISIADISGKELKKEYVYITQGENRKEFSVSDLPNGLYLMKVKDGNNMSTVKFSVIK